MDRPAALNRRHWQHAREEGRPLSVSRTPVLLVTTSDRSYSIRYNQCSMIRDHSDPSPGGTALAAISRALAGRGESVALPDSSSPV